MALYGKMPSVVYEDFPEAKIIVIWGANPSASGIHLVPYIREAQRRGARLVVIDPRTTPLAKQADIHLAVRPGTDLPVALAIHRYLFEEGHADTAFLAAHTRGADRLRERARPWTFERAAAEAGIDAGRASRRGRGVRQHESRDHPMRLGTGAQPQRRQRIARHPGAACGRREVRRARRRLHDEQFRIVGHHAHVDWQPKSRRRVSINMNQLGRALEDSDPPVKVLFVYNNNAAVTSPRPAQDSRGLEREDLFTVVFEQVMTDTARYADVLLPATTFLEGYEIARGYGPISLRLGKPVVEAAGEARSERGGIRRAARAPRAATRRTIRAASSRRCSTSSSQLPQPIGAELRERGAATPPHRRPADSVSRRVAADAGPQGRIFFPRSSTRRRLRASTAIRPIPRRPHFRWRSSRPPASERSARRSPSCRARRSAC